jgi:tetratricopeptide (TPR) repeat protein
LLLSSGLLLGSLALPASAAEPRGGAASNQANVAQLNEEGAAFYAARDYRRAIEKFIQAYAIDSDPNLLFNIARCYEELGENEAAIEKYETFLKTPGADARGRQRARESLTALREAQAAGASGTDTKPTGADHERAEAHAPAADAAPSGPSPWRWVVLGGAVLGAAVGTTFYVMGANDHSEVTDAPGYGDPTLVSSMTQKQAQDLIDSGDSKKLIGGISLGVAGALAATYVVMLVTQDEPKATEAPSLALDWSPNGTSLTWQGRF